ncbi:MAG: hypothetical protein JWR72_1551 [Flavisolibacter sp.]|nr:hypothetical protein [Flavisolibacter sp.]
MIKITATDFQESLHIEEEEIILNGPPGFLTGTIFLKNKEADTIFIRDIAFTPEDQSLSATQLPQSFKLLTSLRAGEERVQQVTVQLPQHTPPGNYEKKLQIGGKEKTVRLIVQPSVEIDINPARIHFQGTAAGKTYRAELTLTNSGNLSFKVPANIKHTTMLDEDYFCRALSLAIREKGGEGFNPTMDELTRNIHKEMTDWVDVRIEESGKVIEPGKSTQLHLSLVLPRNVDSSRDYTGNIRLWNKNISYHINAYEYDLLPK